MTLLLDTHAFLWWLEDNPRLGQRARERIADPDSLVYVSAATAWEIAIKSALGRLDLGAPPEDCVPNEIERGGFRPLPITVQHALAAGSLPRHHGDPFDRMLVAQARTEKLCVVTANAAFESYGVELIAAEA